MRLLKPNWVNHDGKPIFSIDIHPDGTRFATGGQGDDSGKIVIWNMAPVKEENAENDDDIPKILCQMDNHLACVNSVRWANHGRYLASGGDDKLIMIWQCSRSGSSSSVFGSGGSMVNVECWRCACTLRGHSGDVLDLAWSPHDAWLASCSIDNTVVIWNALKLPEQITVLKGHTSLVKGVTWDPVGKYVASQSDDKSFRVWRTMDWQQETCVTEPFRECGGTTHVLRPSWSPDGQYVVSAHAMNNSGPTAQIITRDGWKTDMDFVGHRKAITCVSFNSRIFSKEIKKGSGKKQQYSCCAIGSRDRSISIWLTALKRPLVVLHDLFSNSVMDLSWDKSGFELLSCSWDGTIAYVDFSEDEVGRPLSNGEMTKFQEKFYGKALSLSNGVGTGPQIIESTALLKLQQKQKEATVKPTETTSAQQNNSVTPVKSSSSTSLMSAPGTPGTPSKQIETKTKDGRRRITPIFLAPPPDLGDGPLPFQASSTTFTTTREQSQIQIEKQDIPVPVTGSDKISSSELTPIQPMSALEAQSTSKRKSMSDTPVSEKASKNKQHKHKKRKEEKEKEKSAKRKLDVDKAKKQRKRDKERFSVSSISTPVVSHEKEPATQIVYASSGLSLPVPDIQRRATIPISGEKEVIEIENEISVDSSVLHRINYVKDGDVCWENVVNSKIIAAAGSSRVFCAVCEDQSLAFFSSNGRRLMPNLMLESKLSKLHVTGYYVMAITSQGYLYVWSLQTLNCTIRKESLTSIISGNEISLETSSVTEQGVPIITLSNGKSYTYRTEMGCWLLLSDHKDAMYTCSDTISFIDGKDTIKGPLSACQTQRSRPSAQASRLHRTKPSILHSATVCYLESQVAASLSVQSSKEYKHWLFAYVRCLVQENLESKIRELCDDLLGPMFKSRDNIWDPYVLSLKKRDLLQEILPVIATNLRLQRLFTEYHEQLDTIKDSS